MVERGIPAGGAKKPSKELTLPVQTSRIITFSRRFGVSRQE